ncbi:MAG: capsule assembly Wzi family protein [Gammaproteobacteria bacterium]|nr:capsule assembly Wzi family protein [Gammaproteobacteria bacterium]
MSYTLQRHFRALVAYVVLIIASLLPVSVAGAPMLLPDDLALRSDIQLLADAGLLSGPVSAWPISVAALHNEMRRVSVPADYRSGIRAAWYRVWQRVSSRARLKLKLSAIDEPVSVRRFTATPRGTGANATVDLGSDVLHLQLSTTLQERNSDDRRQARLDGSYAAVRAGKWQLAIGQIPRWWGPGYESSIILSTNARPVPAISLDTVEPLRFQSPWLKWLGPMQWSFFAGELESARKIPGARFLGARLSLRPSRKLELGFSRTAQWGGAGRPQDLSSLLDLILGRDNLGDAGITADNEPGNQLGGIDLRYLSPIGDAPYAVYTQFIGEDEAGGLPSRLTGMAGAEFWRGLAQGNLRIYGEIANTTTEFYKSNPRKNTAYEHGIYNTGYRYRGRTIGHAMDNDGLMLSLGGVWHDQGSSWEGVLRRIEVNTDGRLGGRFHPVSVQAEDRWEIWLATTRPFMKGKLHVGFGSQYINPVQTATEIDSSLYFSWERAWYPAGR